MIHENELEIYCHCYDFPCRLNYKQHLNYVRKHDNIEIDSGTYTCMNYLRLKILSFKILNFGIET